jgi:hypothetical protein
METLPVQPNELFVNALKKFLLLEARGELDEAGRAYKKAMGLLSTKVHYYVTRKRLVDTPALRATAIEDAYKLIWAQRPDLMPSLNKRRPSRPQ